MQLTFTTDPATDSPEHVRRLIAALVVLHDVSIEPETVTTVHRVGDLMQATSNAPLHVHLDRYSECFGGKLPDDIGTPEAPSPMTAAEIAEDDRLGQVLQAAADAGFATRKDDVIDTTAIGFGKDGQGQTWRAGDMLDIVSKTPPPPFTVDYGTDPDATPGTAEAAVQYRPVPPDAAGPAVDSAGMRWDARIHAGTQTKIGDGTWRKKPGVDAALVEQVEAEQKRVTALPPPPPPPATADEAPTDAVGLLQWLTAQSIDPARITEACTKVGLVDAAGNGSIALIMTRADYVPALYAELSQ